MDMSRFQQINQTLSEFRKSIGEEELSPKITQPRGLGFIIREKVDANHVGNTSTRRSMTDFLSYLGSALIFGSRGIYELR